MNVQLPGHMGKQAFLAWVQGREARYELVELPLAALYAGVAVG
jgi:hypothetical protein